MSRVALDVKQIFDWVNDDPSKEGWLIAKVPIRPASLTQMKSGSYKPSIRMVRSCLQAIAEYEQNNSAFGGQKASGS